MRGRLGSLSFFLASLSVAAAWLTVLPVMVRILDALLRAAPEGSRGEALVQHVRATLPFYLAADLLVVVALFALILHFALARPLRRMEETVEQLGRLRLDLPIAPGGGPLFNRIQGSLWRMAQALGEEQALNQRQLEDLRAANERLGQSQAELVASERLATVGRLAAGVAHEVGNPLSGILGYLSLLRMRAGTDPEAAQYVDRIEGEVQRIDRIVRGLLDLGRPQQLQPRRVELRALVQTCVTLLRASPELGGVKVEVEVEDGAWALADPGPLSQVILNLLLNAGQATEGRGLIRVHARTAEGLVRLHVDDDGPGIPEELLSRVFEPFFTTRAAGRGSGLGLAVSTRLLEAMKGRLQAGNRPGGGARFTVELPAA